MEGTKNCLDIFMDCSEKSLINMRNCNIDQIRLRQNFPLGHIYLSSGKNNFISRFIEYCGYQFKTVEMDLNASPVMGLEWIF